MRSLNLRTNVRETGSKRRLARAFVKALLDGDQLLARDLALRTRDLSRSRVEVFADLVQPAMTAIGELWYRGTIPPAVEHQATTIVERIVEELPPEAAASPVAEGSTCLLAALDQERHGIGLKLVAMALEDDGWTVKPMGCAVPQADLLAVTRAIRPQLVGLSASYLPSTRVMRDAIAAVRALCPAVLVGGQAFNRVPDLWQRLGADGCGVDARVGAVMARRLLRR
jgi:methanogenic corrinoid protein MtbC1